MQAGTVDAETKRKKKSKTAQTELVQKKSKQKKARPTSATVLNTASKSVSINLDAQYAHIVKLMQAGQYRDALAQNEALLRLAPNFKLAQLMQADLLSLLSYRKPLMQNFIGANVVSNARLTELRAEGVLRQYGALYKPETALWPSSALQLSAKTKNIIVVDAAVSRIYVFAVNRSVSAAPSLTRIADYYSTLGKQGFAKEKEGDQKTPLGVYFTAAKFTQSLPDLYGAGAIPLDYPNPLDKALGRTGHGIWLHGTPRDTMARAPFASDGCIVLSNQDVAQLFDLAQKEGVPVVVSANLQWVKPEVILPQRTAVLSAIEQWRKDWEQLSFKQYQAHYDANYRSDTHDLAAWMLHKSSFFKDRTWSKITVSDVSLYEVPQALGKNDNVVLAMFTQHYRAEGVDSTVQKRMYLKQTAAPAKRFTLLANETNSANISPWKIILEHTQ